MAEQSLETLSSSSDPPAALTRNSSLSKLNAKAPEFVPKRSPTPPLSPDLIAPRGPIMIVPPPPPPPPSLVHVYPPTPMPVIAPPHLHHPNIPHHHHNNNNNNNNNLQYRKKRHDKDHDGHGHGHGHQDQQSDKVQGAENGGPNKSVNGNGLSGEAAQKLVNQVEYYFSDVNLATTDHLIRFIFKDPEGFVPISVVASFKKIKALISSNSQLAAVLRNSTKLVVSEDGKKVKRLYPLSSSDMEELQARIIVAENLPEDYCHQNLMKIFSSVGSVKSIRTCQPQPSNNGASSGSRQSKPDSMHYSNKVHAFVEYESVELAEKAIVELNNEDSWRNGLRVRLLPKQGSKPAQGRVKKAVNEGEVNGEEEDVSTSEQNQNEKQSEDLSGEPDAQFHEHGDEQSLEKEGGQKKNRNRVRGKGRGRGHNHNNYHHHQMNRGNHGGGPSLSNSVNSDHPVIVKQQPPGPRMPDGTRGFSMGRGRPITVNTA